MTSLTDLPLRHRAIGLSPVLTRLALEGGVAVHPALWFRIESVWPSVWEAIATLPGAGGLVPIWGHGTAVTGARGDGSFEIWNAESEERQERYADLAGLVRALLTDLYEDEVSDDARRQVAELLLPSGDVEAALVPEDR